jgi:hypothetical protein
LRGNFWRHGRSAFARLRFDAGFARTMLIAELTRREVILSKSANALRGAAKM